MKKTNAARIMDRLKIPYSLSEFLVDESDLSAKKAAELQGVPLEKIFKTLVARGESSGVIIASIPGGSELDLKALAKLSGNKKVEMVAQKEVQRLTGYIRGAVSPLGMKYRYSFYLDEKAFRFSSIIINAGARGLQLKLTPRDLKNATGAVTGIITR